MFTKSMFLAGWLMCIGMFGYASAAYGELCSTDSDCTATEHTTCQEDHAACPSKSCSGCADGYELNFAKDGCVASIGTSCTVIGDCLIDAGGNGECSGTPKVCACAANFEYSSYRKCVPTAEKMFGVSCGDVSECHVLATNNGACDSVCTCASGWVKGDTHVCRAPIYDEACAAGGEACDKSTADSSDNDPTCTDNKCQCASTQDKKTFLGVTVCLTAKTDTLDNGLACTAHNQCTSKFCHSCPGTATGTICVGSSSDNNASTLAAISHPLLMLVIALTARVMQM